MAYVIERSPGLYATGRQASIARYEKGSPDLDKARVFKRRCDASNAGGTAETIRTVRLVLVETNGD